MIKSIIFLPNTEKKIFFTMLAYSLMWFEIVLIGL